MKTKKKVKKKRASHYEKPLKIHSTFDEAIKALVSEPIRPHSTK
jgi:hypothetical protein